MSRVGAMDLLQKAAAFNRAGVCMLASGQDHKAFNALNQALKILAALVEESNVDKETNTWPFNSNDSQSCSLNGHCSAETNHFIKSAPAHCPSPHIQKYCVTGVVISALFDDQVYISNKAMIYQMSDDASYSMNDLKFQVSMVLFNMGLCYHKRGKQMQKSALLHRACSLYDRCYNFMLEHIREVGDGMHMLLILALNNQAQIYHELLDIRYQILFSQMVELLSSMFDSVQVDDEILINIVMMRTLRQISAPMA